MVSVIIPNYNHASYLKQRIDSVLNQTFQDFELIILDDCSADNSKEIIESYREHPKISRIVYNDRNSGGVFKQWVKGIEYCKGEFIWIAESDDYAAENFLEEAVALLNKKSSLGMVFTESNTVNEKGKIVTTTTADKQDIYDELSKSANTITKENIPDYLVSEMIISNASSVLFRKESLLKTDFKELVKFTNTGDRFVYIGIALDSEIEFIPKPLNCMRTHPDNTTKKNLENGNIHKDRLRVLNYYYDRIYKASPEMKGIAKFYRENYLIFMNYGDYADNVKLLDNLKKSQLLPLSFYYLVRWYFYLFKKLELKPGILRGIYYRILMLYK